MLGSELALFLAVDMGSLSTLFLNKEQKIHDQLFFMTGLF
jgi:hypothetical protein